MAFLIVAGIQLNTMSDGASQRESEPIGEATRAFGGNLRSGVRAEKRKWAFQIYFAVQADETTFRTAVANRAFVTCSGTALGGSITCQAVMGDTQYKKRTTSSVWRIAALELTEV